MPITNVWNSEEDNPIAYISFTLIVNKAISYENAPNKYERIGQCLILTNREGNETKQYIRTIKRNFDSTSNKWSIDLGMWSENKGVVNLNQIESANLDNYKDNGTYEGAILNSADFSSGNPNTILTTITGAIQAFLVQTNDPTNESKCWLLPTGSLFSMEVKNNYAIKAFAAELGINLEQKITQVVKVQLINGLYAEVFRFSNNDTQNWTPWYNTALYGQVASALG